MANPPSDYRDSYWTNLSTMMEKKHGLPKGLLVNIVQKGERTNNDKKSNVGAQSVYQIIPSTRQAFLKKYGVDAYASPQAAAEVAALHLKESLSRNKGDVNRAVREYHGGTDPKNWGKVNDAYVGRVLGGDSAPSGRTESRTDRAKRRVAERNELEKPTLDKIYQAYKSGKMSQKESSDYERDVQNGSILLGKGQALKGNKKSADQKGIMVPQSVADAYYNGEMDAQAKADLERDRKAGLITLPQPKKLQSSLPDFNEQGVAQTQPETYAGNSPNYNSLSTSDKALGALETAATLGSGAIGGTIGAVGGALLGAGREIASGNFGSTDAANRIAQTASQGAQALTYEPRSQGGRQVLQGVGELAEDTGLTSLPPVLGGNVGAVAGTLGKAAIPAATVTAGEIAQAAKPIAAQAVQAAKTPINAVKSGASNLKNMVTGGEQGNTLANMGAAQVPSAEVRQSLFDQFDVPSTAAQTSRDETQLAELYNTARKGGEAGRVIQNRLDEQQSSLASAIDDIIESKDAKSINSEEIGGNIKKVLGTQYQVERVKARKAYNDAISSEGSKLKIDMSQSPKWTNDQLSDAAAKEINLSDKSAIELINDNLDLESTAFYRDAKKAAIRLGIADENADGKLIPKPSDKLPNAQAIEEWRQAISKNKKIDDKTYVTELKSVIDNVLDNSGGTAFKAARKNYSDFKNSWSSKAIISDLILNKSGANAGDQKVINEKIIDRIVSPSTSQNDLNFIKDMVEKSDGGKSAWNDMQASIMNRIRNEAYSGAQDSQGNNTLVFSRMDKAIKKLDGETRRLDTLLGHEQAQKMRDANELARIIQTVPPNTGVNWSNTMTALAAGVDAFLFGMTGIPATAATALRFAMKYIKDKKDVARAHSLVRKLETTTSKKGEI